MHAPIPNRRVLDIHVLHDQKSGLVWWGPVSMPEQDRSLLDSQVRYFSTKKCYILASAIGCIQEPVGTPIVGARISRRRVRSEAELIALVTEVLSKTGAGSAISRSYARLFPSIIPHPFEASEAGRAIGFRTARTSITEIGPVTMTVTEHSDAGWRVLLKSKHGSGTVFVRPDENIQ
jgi:hypothetical protein